MRLNAAHHDMTCVFMPDIYSQHSNAWKNAHFFVACKCKILLRSCVRLTDQAEARASRAPPPTDSTGLGGV